MCQPGGRPTSPCIRAPSLCRVHRPDTGRLTGRPGAMLHPLGGEACRAPLFVHPPARPGRPWTESTIPGQQAGFRVRAARESLGVPSFFGELTEGAGQALFCGGTLVPLGCTVSRWNRGLRGQPRTADEHDVWPLPPRRPSDAVHRPYLPQADHWRCAGFPPHPGSEPPNAKTIYVNDACGGDTGSGITRLAKR